MGDGCLIQALESRILFTALPATIVADELGIVKDAQALRADLRSSAKTLLADVHRISADLRSLPRSASNTRLLSILSTDQHGCVATLRADETALIRAGGKLAVAAAQDGIRVFYHVANAKFLARLLSALTSLQRATQAPLARLNSDGVTCSQKLVGDVSAVAAANPSDAALQQDVPAVQSDVTSTTAVAQAGANKLQGDIGKLVSDLQ